MHYKLSPRQIARCRCNDCGVNVIEAGDYCMLRPRIWRDTFGLGITDNLCLACIEKRLGRAIAIGDVITFPVVEGYPMSDTLHARLFPIQEAAQGEGQQGGRGGREMTEQPEMTERERDQIDACPQAAASGRSILFDRGLQGYWQHWSAMAVKWRALSLKRFAHFDELKRAGRWRHHFDATLLNLSARRG